MSPNTDSGPCPYPTCRIYCRSGPAGGLAAHLHTVHRGEPPPGVVYNGPVTRHPQPFAAQRAAALRTRRTADAAQRRKAAAARSRQARDGQ